MPTEPVTATVTPIEPAKFLTPGVVGTLRPTIDVETLEPIIIKIVQETAKAVKTIEPQIKSGTPSWLSIVSTVLVTVLGIITAIQQMKPTPAPTPAVSPAPTPAMQMHFGQPGVYTLTLPK